MPDEQILDIRKEYLTLEETAADCNITMEDLRYFGEEGLLSICLRRIPVRVAVESIIYKSEQLQSPKLRALAVIYFTGKKGARKMKRHLKIKRFWRTYRALIVLGLGFAILILCASCATNTSGDYCLLYHPVYADYEKDTPETIKQIDDNNVVYDAICGR